MHVARSKPSCVEHVDHLRRLVDEALAGLIDGQEPADLYESARYVLAGGGKRLRPVLLLLAAEAFGVAAKRALPAALAVEVFHNFTLVHDDIMDHADERRGRGTVHRVWDVGTAILCGDLLMGLSYNLLGQVETSSLPTLLRVYSQMLVHLCEGQTLDKVFEQRTDVSVGEYVTMIDRKTAALLQTALELGGILGGASPGQRTVLREVGRDLGRAFQIQDDLLDLVAEDTRWGKTVGGDLIEGKKTFLLLQALERSEGEAHAWFKRIVTDGGLPPGAVEEARSRMEDHGVLAAARQAVLEHSQAALAGLERLPQGSAAEALRWLIHRLQARLH